MHVRQKTTYKVGEIVADLFEDAGWYFESYTDYIEKHIQLYEVWPQGKMGSSRALYLPFYLEEVIVEVVD